jgi:hypothetical protein
MYVYIGYNMRGSKKYNVKKGKNLFLQQVVEAHRIVKHWGSHTF